MDERNPSTGTVSDEEIFDQLRQYADALAARTDRRPSSIATFDAPHEAVAGAGAGAGAGPEDVAGARRRAPLLAVAAAVAVVIGAAAWFGSREDSNSVRSTADQPTTTTENDGEADTDERIGAAAHLMPDPAQWIITEAYPPQTSPTRQVGGTWAWRLDGQIFLLLDGVGIEDLGPLSEADVDVGDDRVMMGWLDGDRRLGLQGYGVDEPTLRAVADALEPTASGWALPGAEVLVANSGGDSGPTESVQVGYSPVTADGAPDLSVLVTAVRSRGTEADLYRELFEASGLGTVVETTVAGEPGYVITGPYVSYALVYRDGWVSTWHTTTPDVDLADLLGSIRPVSPEEWDQAVAGADDAMAAGVEATMPALDGSELDRLDPTNDPDLPRYRLPEPWTFEWVTDMGLWSAEERAQREALSAAHAPPGGFAELVWTQGFVRSHPETVRFDALPFAVPELVVEVHRRETEAPIEAESPESRPFSFAGLDGRIERYEIADPNADGGSRTEVNIVAAQGPMVVRIDWPFASEEDMRRFAESLSLVGDDLSRGFESASDELTLLTELPGDAGNGADLYSRWSAAYVSGEGDDTRHASLSVDSLTFEQLQHDLLFWSSVGADYEPVSGGRYLAHQYERAETTVIGDDAVSHLADPSMAGEWTTLLRYDPDAGILISLDAQGDLDATIALLEQLTEVDIEQWRELVEPYNAKPLEPR